MEPQSKILQRRPLITGAPFFLRVDIPFTSTAAETATVYTTQAQNAGDLEILGGVMNLESVQGKYSVAGAPIWGSSNTPLAMDFGKPDGPKPIIFHQPTLPLGHRQQIKFDLVNTGAEGPGTLVLLCRQKNVPAPQAQALLDYQGKGRRSRHDIDSGFAGTALNQVVPKTSEVIDDDFIWKSMHTNLSGASVRIFGIDGRGWMDDFIPLWALAGRATSQIPNQPVQPPVFIPAGFKVGFEFKNEGDGATAETSGRLWLDGQRILPIR
jgi:hypothetical protein